MEHPVYSIIVSSRNDTHGGSALVQMQAFIDCLHWQAEKHSLPAELLVVEWNPPAGRPKLKDAIKWPATGKYLSAKVIEVPPELHKSIPNSASIEFFQMLAKNVGLRRARGKYALCTNMDIVFSDTLCAWLADFGNVAPGVLYRNCRYDCACPESGLKPQEILDFCERSIIRKNTAFGSYVKLGAGKEDGFKSSKPMLARAMTKTKAWFSFLHRHGARLSLRKGFPRACPRSLGNAAFLCAGLGATAVNGRLLKALKYENDSFRCSLLSLLLNCHASGDFTLMDTASWLRLRGYYEKPCYSWGLDSLFLFCARANGFKVQQLPPACKTYHREHEDGWTPEKEKQLFAQLRSQGTPYLDRKAIVAAVAEMEASRRKGVSYSYNSESWGFNNEKLVETICRKALS